MIDINYFDQGNVKIMSRKYLARGAGDVTMLSRVKMAVGWLKQTWHDEGQGDGKGSQRVHKPLWGWLDSLGI